MSSVPTASADHPVQKLQTFRPFWDVRPIGTDDRGFQSESAAIIRLHETIGNGQEIHHTLPRMIDGTQSGKVPFFPADITDVYMLDMGDDGFVVPYRLGLPVEESEASIKNQAAGSQMTG